MRWSIGSTWLRWDPHIHAPGTLKENHYGSHDDATVWERYFAKIREARPHLRISPDPEDHLAVIESKLAALTFTYGGEEYRCTEGDLRRLGRAVHRDSAARRVVSPGTRTPP
jgi:hypothetical protein